MTTTDAVNLALAVLFGAFAIMMLVHMVRYRKWIQIPDRQWSALKIIFLAIGILTILSFFTNTSMLTTISGLLRTCTTIAAVIIYLMMKDGIGEKGLVSGINAYAWKDIKAYDFEEDNKNFRVFFVLDADKGDQVRELVFDRDKEEEVRNLLKNHIGRKYTRMKKR